jgi:hypothetical protein
MARAMKGDHVRRSDRLVLQYLETTDRSRCLSPVEAP